MGRGRLDDAGDFHSSAVGAVREMAFQGIRSQGRDFGVGADDEASYKFHGRESS